MYNKMEESGDEEDYPDRNTRYPSIPPENAENFALGSQYLDLTVQQYHQQRAEQQRAEQQQLAEQKRAEQLAEQQHHIAPVDVPHHDEEVEDQPPATKRRASTTKRRVPATRRQVSAATRQAPVSEHQTLVTKRYTRANVARNNGVKIKEEVDDDEDNHLASNSEEEDNEQVDEPATVSKSDLKYSTKEMRDQQMSIFHRKEFAFCEIAITNHEHMIIKGLNHVTPQTFSLPDKNGKYHKKKRIRITWAERDILNAWRIANGLKPHKLKDGAKYAAAREYWRLRAPLHVEPRKTREWRESRGPVPAP
ncbi:hypothetical protein SBOR_8715 [Sclerotinia borealis F-4128]|uniref:Uncharacterized protein n=1 Tax=Sclerotinia borealis (strain F-4128) TaxID=1432307 RepID=W9C5C2_SCLBF|nr:hypothetical protein SBOR_8715 [Sclerotinia borealis F-4128]